MVGEIERRLADGRPHLLGETFSAVDVLLTSCLVLGAVHRVPLADRSSPIATGSPRARRSAARWR
jgi:glutathione S-transferase